VYNVINIQLRYAVQGSDTTMLDRITEVGIKIQSLPDSFKLAAIVKKLLIHYFHPLSIYTSTNRIIIHGFTKSTGKEISS
jgi:hypothetical protein